MATSKPPHPGDLCYGLCGEELVPELGIFVSPKLVSIRSYGGDYAWWSNQPLRVPRDEPAIRLSLMANFGDFWRRQHRSLFQKAVIDCIFAGRREDEGTKAKII